MKVLIADDHKMFREGLKRILEDASGIRTVGEAEDVQSLLDKLGEQDWSIVILDIHMPGRSGLDALKEIKDRFPRLSVLVLSMYPEDQYAVRVMKAGASGYLTKASAPDELVNALRRIASGSKYISPSVAEKLADAIKNDTTEIPHEKLSDREFTVLRMIGGGMTVGEIAKELSLSVKTISTYRTKILDKMDLRNNADIMSYVLQHGLKD